MSSSAGEKSASMASAKENGKGGSGRVHKVVIIGSGPAAHTAAIYAARARLEPLVFEGFMAGGIAAGGQLTTTTDVENFPGFPEGIGGTELAERFRAQSRACGATLVEETVEGVDLSVRPFVVRTSSSDAAYAEVRARTLIVATGATARRMDIPGAGEGPDGYWQRGVSACAVCDGAAPIFRDRPIIVVGGGDSAAEEATYLTKYASEVLLVHRRDELRASKVMQARVLGHPKVRPLLSHVVVSVRGDGARMTHATVRDLKTGDEREIAAGGLFFAIGHVPNTSFLGGALPTDAAGYLLLAPAHGMATATAVPGVFAAGDVADARYRQAVSAAGTGCMAALDAERFLCEHDHDCPSDDA